MTPARVLVVDDHAENRYFLRALLEGSGLVVDEARHGEEAMERARVAVPDLVVSDLLMPVMDGYALLREWRRDARLRPIPFLVYTATFTEPRDERLAMALGASAFLVKPAEPMALLASVRELLARPRVAVDPQQDTRPLEEDQLLREYNEVLVAKLEQKARELEATNRELREEVAERRRNEETLRLRDRAIQQLAQGILITQHDPRDAANAPIIYASAGFERMTGYSAAEVAGKNCRFLQGKDTDRATVAALREAIGRSRPISVEILNYRKDGSPFWNALSLNPVFSDGGVLEYYVGVQTDITERRQLEEQLRQSQKMEAVGRLAGGVAHDFNNILTVIGGYSEQLLGEGGLDEDQTASVVAIHEAGRRAGQLTRQLLSFSRQAILQPRIVDVNVQVAKAAQLLRRLIGEDIEFTTVLDQHCGTVRVDPGQLDQVLMNLAVNARDAMPNGGRLTLETHAVEVTEAAAAGRRDCPPGPYVVIAMTDTGVGMPADVLARVFEPFFTTKAPGQGTGLGLAMVFGIVQQSGGTIEASSEVGVGTTFRIHLPVVTAPPPRASEPVSADVPLGTETVLVVEDDEGVRALAVRSLRALGYTTLVAESGPEALAVGEQHAGTIDLLLTDVVMPQIGGPALAERLQSLRPGLKVIFMSGYTDDAVIRHGLQEESVAFIQKPYSPKALARKVREVLDGVGRGA